MRVRPGGQVFCDTQKEMDDYWEKPSEDGKPKTQVCGSLKEQVRRLAHAAGGEGLQEIDRQP